MLAMTDASAPTPPMSDELSQLHTSAGQRERRMRVVEFLESVMQDVRYAARGLARRPAFTAVAVLTLAIGVGATTAIFSAVNVLLLRPLPSARPNELMKVSLILPAEGGHPELMPGFAYPTYTAIRDGQRSFSVSASYLRTLGLVPIRGRDFDRSLDAHTGAPHEAIVSYAVWQRRFNADPSVVGRTIDIDREPWTIVGVGPREFRGLSERAAKTFFGADDPIGKRVSVGRFVKDAEVMGIVGDVRPMPDSAAGATTYAPSTQLPQGRMTVVVRTTRDAATIANELRRAVREVAPQLPLSDMQTMTQRAHGDRTEPLPRHAAHGVRVRCALARRHRPRRRVRWRTRAAHIPVRSGA